MSILHLNFTTNSWLSNIKIDKEQTYLNNLLNLGYIVSQQVKIECNDDKLENKLDELNDKNMLQINHIKELQSSQINNIMEQISTLKNSIKKCTETTQNTLSENSKHVFDMVSGITGKTNIAAHKGQIGENYIYNILNSAYPNSTIQVSVSESKQSDLQIKLENYPEIFIESKNYSNPVPSKEIAKFKRDLDVNNISLGIFISFNQSISTIHNKIHLEYYNEKIIIYASNLQFNPSDVILPLEFIKKIHDINSKNNNNKMIINSNIRDKLPNILSIVKDLDVLHKETCQHIHYTKEQKKIINKAMDDLLADSINTYSNIKHIINNVKQNIIESINDIMNENLEIYEADKINFDELTEKYKPIYLFINDNLPENYSLRKIDKNICIIHNDSIFAKFTENKSKLKIKLIKLELVMNLYNNNVGILINLIKNN
jgi:hypothetical protein